MDASKPQSPPITTDSDVVWPHVIRDIMARVESGKAKYGVELQVENGRDPLVDLYQELIDGVMYLKQVMLTPRPDDPGPLLRRIHRLEDAIREHKEVSETNRNFVDTDEDLWEVLNQ